ncbi:hypothetical protein [Streptomyces sp. NPDC001927]
MRAPFDLVHGPLLRIAVLRTADDEHAHLGHPRSFDVRPVDGNHRTTERAPHIEGVAAVLNDVLNAAPRGDGGDHA